jgi:hypothetical protein
VSCSTLARITKVTIESRHKFVTIGGEEEGCYDCGVNIVHGGIPHDGACPPTGGAHSGGSQYPWPESGGGVLELWTGWPARGGGGQYPPRGCGGQYPAGGGGGGHIEGCLAVGDPPHGIMDVRPI